MDKKTKILLGIGIALICLLSIFIISGLENKKVEKEEILRIERDTVYMHDTITKFKKGKNIYHTVVEHKTDSIFLTKQDTIYIIKDYDLVRTYIDTLDLNDSNTVVIVDTVTKNQILSRQWTSSVRSKIIYEKVYIKEKEKPKNEVYLGTILSHNNVKIINSVNASLLFKSKKNKIILISGGLDYNLKTNFSTGLYWKLK